ncbi:hypothetical protein COO60DRAFT_1553690 [Scenedesmus sp. NREL 46B-D3]|nr:hypothetical protein COO60DRAFT_1553690 [Scenedesmus sp. NREL 46B-D3]
MCRCRALLPVVCPAQTLAMESLLKCCMHHAWEVSRQGASYCLTACGTLGVTLYATMLPCQGGMCDGPSTACMLACNILHSR